MMKKILIYGYGWVGESALEFFLSFDFYVRVYDDKLDFSRKSIFDENFISGELDLLEFDLVIIAVFENHKACRLKDKLLRVGVREDKIKNFRSQNYTKNMKYLNFEYFGSATELFLFIQKDNFVLDNFHQKLQNLIHKHYANKVNRGVLETRIAFDALEERSVYAKMYETAPKIWDSTYLNYPGFYIANSKSHDGDQDFYFVKKIDFEALASRDRKIKLVACMGNSALRVDYLSYEDTITGILQKELGREFIVVNFGVTGSTLYEQFLLYNALVYPLKPDIVLTFFGGTEMRCAVSSCDVLIKRHKMVYVPQAWEESCKMAIQSKLPLYSEMAKISNAINHKVCVSDVVEAVNERLRQFERAVVSGGGGGQILCLYSTPIALQVKMDKGRARDAA